MSRIATAIQDAVKTTVLHHIDSPVTGLTSDMPALDARTVAKDVAADLAPVVANLTNNEPWWQSRVTWGALIAIALPLLRVLGVETAAIDPASVLDVVMSVAAAAGGAYAIYGRYVGRKPLGA